MGAGLGLRFLRRYGKVRRRREEVTDRKFGTCSLKIICIVLVQLVGRRHHQLPLFQEGRKMKLLLPVAALFFLVTGMSAQGIDSTTTCNICTLQLGYSSIANALNVCNLTDTVGNCQTDCASALQSIRTNFGCCFNAYYNSTGILSTCASSLAAYELWASVPNVYSNPFPVDPGDGAFVRGNAQLLL